MILKVVLQISSGIWLFFKSNMLINGLNICFMLMKWRLFKSISNVQKPWWGGRVMYSVIQPNKCVQLWKPGTDTRQVHCTDLAIWKKKMIMLRRGMTNILKWKLVPLRRWKKTLDEVLRRDLDSGALEKTSWTCLWKLS